MSRPPSWRPTAKAQYQHEYREEKKAEVASLRIKVAELETMLVRLHERAATPRRRRKHDFMLSWQQVALALRTSARDAMVTHRDLDNKVEAHREALQRLQAWVALATTNAVPMHPPWGVANMSLARMPLVKHPIARRHGLDWLTQLMFHNTDAILATYQFPPILSTHAAPCFRLVVEDRASDGSVAVVSQYMKVFHGAIEAVVRCVYDREIQHKSYTNVSSAECLRRRIDVASPDDETVRNVAENSAVGSRALSYVRVATRGMQKATCILYRTFVCDSPVRKDIDDPSIVPTIPPTPRHGTDQRHKRCVVVGQSVPQDEKFPSAAIGRKTLSWYVFDEVAPQSTVLRHVYVSHGAVDAATGDSVPLEREAALWGCHLDTNDLEHIQLERFRRHMQRLGARAATQQDETMHGVDAALLRSARDPSLRRQRSDPSTAF